MFLSNFEIFPRDGRVCITFNFMNKRCEFYVDEKWPPYYIGRGEGVPDNSVFLGYLEQELKRQKSNEIHFELMPGTKQ